MTQGYNNIVLSERGSGNYKRFGCVGRGVVQHLQLQFNRSCPSFLLPLVQNESKCKTFLTKMSLICIQMNL